MPPELKAARVKRVRIRPASVGFRVLYEFFLGIHAEDYVRVRRRLAEYPHRIPPPHVLLVNGDGRRYENTLDGCRDAPPDFQGKREHGRAVARAVLGHDAERITSGRQVGDAG